MKNLVLLSAAALALAGCQKPTAQSEPEAHHEHAASFGATFKKGQGILLPEKMCAAIGLQIVEVGEQKIAPSFSVGMQVLRGADGFMPVANTEAKTEISGWLSAAQAALVKPGLEVELRTTGPEPAVGKGIVKRVEKAFYATLGDFEVTIETPATFTAGARLEAHFRSEAGDAVPAIPLTALLRTAEGTFIYAVNGEALLRTPVKTGAMNEQFVEITDGLYAGDRIAATPVMSLWMAELQTLRGGKSCCDVH